MALKPLIAGMSQSSSGGGGGGSFDPHSPGPIGDVTPGTGAFTALSTSGSFSISDGISRVTEAGGLIVDSGGFGRPLKLQTGGVDRIRINTDGSITSPSNDTLALRNGTNARKFEVYGTYTDGSNYSQVGVGEKYSRNGLYSEGVGTGAFQALNLTSSASSAINFYPANNHAWIMSSSGHFLAVTNNTYDIGNGSTADPRYIYAGTGFVGNGSQITSAAGSLTFDTGWVANADAGDKTSVIGSNATFDGMITALDILSTGLGTQLALIAKKVKAIESALAMLLAPNA